MNGAELKESPLYALPFTVVLCACCGLLLTWAQTGWRERIRANEDFERIRAIVMSLGLTPRNAERAEVLGSYRSNVEAAAQKDLVIYKGRRDEKTIGYALDILGRGKYGPIKGVLSFSSKRDRILDLDIYQQEETPGLGGRIASREWLDQFKGIPLVTDGIPGVIISSTKEGPNVVDGITGASKTTFEIVKIINAAVASFLAGGRRLLALDLGLAADAVTQATPGYPKHLDKPPHLREEIKRPPFMVPPGVGNIALNRPVTCSMEDFPIIGELEQITDGIKKSGEFDFVELDFGPQWVQIDMGREAVVFAVAIWHYYKNPVVYNDVIVQLSNDPGFESEVITLFNNDHDNSSKLGAGTDTAYCARWWSELVDARGDDLNGTRGRYVRVYTNGGAADEDTRFVEIAVYGKKADSDG